MMGSWRYLFGALVAAAASAGLAFGKVVELGDSDFDTEMAKFDTALVMFFAPWCGHCKKIKPEFDAASGSLEKGDYPVQLAKVDCTEAGKDTCSRFGVSGYPTLRIFHSGELSDDYNGPRDSAGIVKHMKAKVGPASIELADDKAYEKLLDSSDNVVVVAILEEPDQMSAFQTMASKLREMATFAHSSTASGTRKAGIWLHRPKHLRTKMEDHVVKYDGKVDSADFSKFVKENYHGLVGHRTPDNSADFDKGTVLVAYYAIDYARNPKGTNYWRNRIMKVAKAFVSSEEKLSFAISNLEDFHREVDGYGLVSTSDKPVVAIKDGDGRKFVMEEEFSVDALTKFTEAFAAGKLHPYMKSEPVPESNDGPVKVAVAKNFDELVTNSGKDVLVEFYAPWCGHCKSLAPVFDELGEKMAGEEINIVKMDATANDVPSAFEVKGFPTIYWLKRGEKPVAYNGGREINDFVKYIAIEATNELKGYDRKGSPNKTEL